MKTFRIAILATALVAAGAPPLGLSDLNENATSYLAFSPKSTFDAPPRLASLIGSSFKVEVPFANAGARTCDSGQPVWRYDAETETLHLFVAPAMIVRDGYKTKQGKVIDAVANHTSLISYQSFMCSRKVLADYRAQNGFGAKTTVSRVVYSGLGVAWDGETELAEKILKLPPAAARAQIARLRLRIEGEIGDWRDGRPLICGEDKSEASFQDPIEITHSSCLFFVKRVTLSIIDTGSGEILQDFSHGDH